MYLKNIALCALTVMGSATCVSRRTPGQIKEIKTAEEYKKLSSSIQRPTIFVFNSASCTACKMMTKGLEAAAKNYPQADFYVIEDLKSDAFKGLPQELKIKGYPTTHLCKPKTEPCVERGSIGDEELDELVYKLVHGKPKQKIVRQEPAKPEAPSANTTKSDTSAKK